MTDARALAAYGEVLDMAAAAAVVPGPAAGDAAARARRMAAMLLGWVEPVMGRHLRYAESTGSHAHGCVYVQGCSHTWVQPVMGRHLGWVPWQQRNKWAVPGGHAWGCLLCVAHTRPEYACLVGPW